MSFYMATMLAVRRDGRDLDAPVILNYKLEFTHCKRCPKKNEKKTNNDNDFETYVRQILENIGDMIKEIKTSQSHLHKEVSELKGKVSSNQQTLAALQQQQESLILKYEKLNGENFDTSNKIDNMEESLASSEETINRLQEQLEAYKER